MFPFEFLAAEKLCAIRRKVRAQPGRGQLGRGHGLGTPRPSRVPRQEHVWRSDETLLKVPPKLILQVWDNDKFKADDLLGETLCPREEGDTAGDRNSHWGQGQ